MNGFGRYCLQTRIERMSQQIREQLSTLMDGELARDETLFLMRRLGNDGELAQCWSSYHAVRQVLRRQDLFLLRRDFSEQILARIDAEAAPHVSRGGSWLRWAGGGAIAASVAVVALVFSGARNDTSTLTGAPLAASVNSASQPLVPSAPRPGEFRAPLISPALDVQPASVSTAGFSNPSTAIDPRLQSYLIRHYDAAASNGQSAMMPYVLLVVPPQPQVAREAVEGTSEQR